MDKKTYNKIYKSIPNHYTEAEKKEIIRLLWDLANIYLDYHEKYCD